MDEKTRDRVRASLAEYEVHRERGDADPDAQWWYAAWAETLALALKAAVADDAMKGAHYSSGPEILDRDAEQEVLSEQVITQVERTVRLTLRNDLTVVEGARTIAAMAVTGVLQSLRFMSGRQMAVLLAREADTGTGYLIREPPHYTAEDIAAVR
jgi:hypothetical protein